MSCSSTAGRRCSPESVTVHGTGSAGTSVPEVGDVTASDAAEGTVIRSGALEILVHRRLDPAAPATARALVGTWEGQDTPVALAAVTEG